MPLRAPDKALRRLVADLAQAAPDDVELILSELDEAQREQVRGLLSAYLGEPPPATAPAAAASTDAPVGLNLAGVSPWLAVRVEQALADRPPGSDLQTAEGIGAWDGGRVWSMTPTALRALQAAAHDLLPVASPSPPPVERRAGFARLIPNIASWRRDA